MKNTDKVTLTIGQLKKLIRESYDEDDEFDRDSDDNQSFVWTITKAFMDEKGRFYEDGDEIAQSRKGWDYPEPAFKDVQRKLKTMKPGNYYIVVYDENGEEMDPVINSYFNVSRSGRIKQID